MIIFLPNKYTQYIFVLQLLIIVSILCPFYAWNFLLHTCDFFSDTPSHVSPPALQGDTLDGGFLKCVTKDVQAMEGNKINNRQMKNE